MKNLNYKSIISLLCTAIILAVSFQTAHAYCHEKDFKALKDFYESTHGDNWKYNTGWELVKNNVTPPSDCDLRKLKGVSIWHGRVVNLGFNRNNISGELPETIYLLEKLRGLHITGNPLSGAIPSTIGSMENLKSIELKDNNIENSIPSSIGFLKNLTHLSLGNNHLTGVMPTEIGNCIELKSLQLYGNKLSGEIPKEIGQLKKLHTINFNKNNISGSIPVELGACENLSYCLMNDNELSNSIPISMGELKNLRRLNINNNQLSGEIPKEIGQLSKLSQLDLSNNHITGSIPKELASCENLNSCILNDNKLGNIIPEEIGNLKRLREFYLYNNNFEGCYPNNLGKICSTLHPYANVNNRISDGNNFDDSWENFDLFFMGACEDESKMASNNNKSIAIYPNPSQGNFNLSILKDNLSIETSVKLIIYNTTGSIVYSENFSEFASTDFNINVSHLVKGSYFITLNNEETIYSEKLMIK